MPVSVHFYRRCRWLRMATWLVFVGLAVLLCFGASSLMLLPGDAATTGVEQQLLLWLVRLSPGLGYLWALWAVQRALAELGGGRVFHATVARALRQIGWGVLVGALLSVFAVTNVTRWIEGGVGGYAYFDLSGMVLGVVGAALILLANVVDQARAMQAELDEIL